MAETTDRHERTEQPTSKRLEDARRRGQVPRSRDLTAAAVMIAAGSGLYAMGAPLGRQLAEVMRATLSLTREQALDAAQMLPILANASFNALLATAPVLACTLLAAVAAPLALGGWAFSGEALTPKFERLDPIAGPRAHSLSVRGWVELGKSFAKFMLVGIVGVIVLWTNLQSLLGLGRASRWRRPSATPARCRARR